MQIGEGERSEKEEGKRRRRDMCGGQERQEMRNGRQETRYRR
jgi:hypothetical protein